MTETKFETAKELWNHISPSNWESRCAETYLFRGQADSRWDLIPTILRKGTGLLSFDKKWQSQLNSEMQLMSSFVKCCHEVGLQIPDKPSMSNPGSFSQESVINDNWSSEPWLEIKAIAQLHGFQTRLLDWSVNPFVAAYFASSDAMRQDLNWNDGQRLAVFRLDAEKSNVKIHRPRGSVSRNAAVQQVAFTVHPLNDHCRSLEHELNVPPEKLTIPIAECARLYQLCDLSGFNAARLFPDATGVGRTVMDRLNSVIIDPNSSNNWSRPWKPILAPLFNHAPN